MATHAGAHPQPNPRRRPSPTHALHRILHLLDETPPVAPWSRRTRSVAAAYGCTGSVVWVWTTASFFFSMQCRISRSHFCVGLWCLPFSGGLVVVWHTKFLKHCARLRVCHFLIAHTSNAKLALLGWSPLVRQLQLSGNQFA